jgi:hypothetical protein
MLDSNPDASSAHMVVNIASLPSMVTALGAAAVRRETPGGAAFAGACVCTSAGAGTASCAVAFDNTAAAHNPASTAIRRSFFMATAAASLSRVLSPSASVVLNKESHVLPVVDVPWRMPALFQSTVAPQSRQGIACVRGKLPPPVFVRATAGKRVSSFPSRSRFRRATLLRHDSNVPFCPR